MMAQYYTKIRLGRMATLLALTEAETEDCLSDMVRYLIISLCRFIPGFSHLDNRSEAVRIWYTQNVLALV